LRLVRQMHNPVFFGFLRFSVKKELVWTVGELLNGSTLLRLFVNRIVPNIFDPRLRAVEIRNYTAF
ncbi:MAG TPA: hypothetical protein VMD27_09990, partial [Candidatus Aquilonibacter sp.]|nr:hypothetical protein [Candidatus Aquilonibacter sp.]